MISNQDGSEAQEQALELCEVALLNGLRRQLEGGASVGAQLEKIRVNELYRAAGCASFELYCREVLQMARDQVRRMIQLHEVVETLRGASLELPVSETQALMLSKIPREELPDRWRTLLELCVSEQIALSDRVVRRAVEIARKGQSSHSGSMDGERAKRAPRGVQVDLEF